MEKRKTYSIEGKSEKIAERLKDLEHYGRLHPLIRSVEKLSSSNQGQLYRIIERPFSWIPINIQYKALVKTTRDEIEYAISELPLTQAFITYTLAQESELVTKIQFHLKIKSRATGKRFLLNKVVHAQDQLMHSLQNEIKTDESSI